MKSPSDDFVFGQGTNGYMDRELARPDDPLLTRPKQPEEWQQGETVTATKKAMRIKLAEGIVQFCRLCGTQIDDKAVDDLVAVLEKHS